MKLGTTKINVYNNRTPPHQQGKGSRIERFRLNEFDGHRIIVRRSSIIQIVRAMHWNIKLKVSQHGSKY